MLRVFQRARARCDEKKLLLALAGIYERTGHVEDAEKALSSACRKFSQSCKVWLRRAAFDLAAPAAGASTAGTVDRAVKALPARKHVKFLTQAALLEFRAGSPERARTLFEGVLQAHPRRMDLWSVYIDQEARARAIQAPEAEPLGASSAAPAPADGSRLVPPPALPVPAGEARGPAARAGADGARRAHGPAGEEDEIPLQEARARPHRLSAPHLALWWMCRKSPLLAPRGPRSRQEWGRSTRAPPPARPICERRYLQYEAEHGDEASVAHVRKLAAEFVESKGGRA